MIACSWLQSMEMLEKPMLRIILTFLLLSPFAASAGPWFDGNPDFTDSASEDLATELLNAHGGMQPMREATSLQFRFFTKMLGNPTPFYSHEALNTQNGSAYIEWPFWDASIAWNNEMLWTQDWPMPLPAGFFVRLTSSFLSLPWQLHADNANVGPVSEDRLPEDETIYDVLRVTFDNRNPGIPGTFYDVFVHPETRLMTAIRFDINHPGMAANPNQPLGPNYHVFGDYRVFDGLVFPTFYKSYGQGSGNGNRSNAYHFVWNMQLDQPFDESHMRFDKSAQLDRVSIDWWQSSNQSTSGEK